MMPHYPVLQPDGQWAVFSTIVDAFTVFDATINEALDELEKWHKLDRAEQVAHLERIAAGEQPRYPHWHDWDASAAWMLFLRLGTVDETSDLINERTPPERMARIMVLVAQYQKDGA